MSLFIDVHAIQTVPPANLNRDFNGSPKSAIYGGYPRARVSSQAWKRPIRKYFDDEYSVEDLGIRTKRVVSLMAQAISAIDPELEEVGEIAQAAFDAAGIKLAPPRRLNGEEIALDEFESKYLIFLSRHQINNAAQVAVEAYRDGGVDAVKKAKKPMKAALSTDASVDLALFGRMVADDADLNVDATCQVAHALSTHTVTTEYDFFTAVDDEKERSVEEDAGAGMMGTVEFNSATLYRFASVNATALEETLGNAEATATAIQSFLKAFLVTLPTGKQNTFAAFTLPTAFVVSVRTDRPTSWVEAFERPVVAEDPKTHEAVGYVANSVSRMLDYAADLDGAYGGPSARFAGGVGRSGEILREHGYQTVSQDELCQQVAAFVRDDLSGQEAESQ